MVKWYKLQHQLGYDIYNQILEETSTTFVGDDFFNPTLVIFSLTLTP